jgi:hypothetical protein
MCIAYPASHNQTLTLTSPPAMPLERDNVLPVVVAPTDGCAFLNHVYVRLPVDVLVQWTW